MRPFEDYCWRDLVDDEVRHIYSPYVRDRAVGRRPALLAVHGAPWPHAATRFVEEARRRKIPVVHSANALAIGARPGEAVCARPCESAFFSSDLERTLTRLGAGALVVCGAPTSGAVRASAVEGKSFGYKVALAEEAVADQTAFLHKIALFDMAHKYADVMSLEELLAQL
ncbi:MAG: isochorismatase family protein [Betaproteobacteria bacterium]